MSIFNELQTLFEGKITLNDVQTITYLENTYALVQENDAKEVKRLKLGSMATENKDSYLKSFSVSLPNVFTYNNIVDNNNGFSMQWNVQTKNTFLASPIDFDGTPIFRNINKKDLLDANVIFDDHVSANITEQMIESWNTAFEQSHIHLNKSILDETEESFTTQLKNKLDNLFNYELPTASVTVLGGVKVGTNLSIDSSGVLSAIDTTYTSGTLSVLNVGTSTILSVWSAKVLNDWLNEKGYLVSNDLIGFASETWVSNNFISNTHISNEITLQNINNWNTAFANNHTHTNKSILDATTASFTTTLKDKLDGLVNYTLPTASTTVLGGVKVGTNLSIDTNGVLSAINTTYTAGTLAVLNAGTATTQSTWTAKILNDWLNGKNFVTASIIDGLASQTWVSDNFISNTHVVNGITATNILDWNTAFTNTHTHNNKAILDGTQESFTTALKTKLDGLSNYVLPTASTTVLGGVKVGTNLTIDANGVLSSTNTTYSNMTITELNTGTVTSARSISAKVLNDWLNGKNFVTASIIDGLASQTWVSNNFISNTHVVNGITETMISNWNTAFSNNHTHTNKAILDATTASFTTALKTKLDGLSNYVLPTASATVLGGVKVGTNLSIDVNGVLSATNTTYTAGTLTILNDGTDTTQSTWTAKILNDWLRSKDYVTSSILSNYATQTWVSDNFISNTHVVNGITSTMISNWNTAFTNNHTHTNKDILDATTASFTTALKTKLDGLSNYVLPTASATVLGGVKVGTNLSIDANGVLSATNTTYGVETLANLNTGTSTTGLLQSAKNLNDWLNGKNFVTASIIDGLASQTWVSNNFISNTHVVNGITATNISNWNTAFTNNHTHSNKDILDATTASFTTALKTKLDGLSNYVLPTASATVLGGVKIGTNLSIDANGVLSATNTTYGVETLANLNTGTSTTGLLQSAKNLNDWLNGKNFVTQTWVYDNFISNTHVVNGITSTMISNWNTAFVNNHTHSNKNILDATTASFTTVLKDKLDGLSNYVLPTASATVLGGVKIGTNLSIDANGVLSATNTTYSNMTISELNTGTVTSARSISAKVLNDWLNGKNFVTASIIDGLASQTWVSDNFISNTHVANGITTTNISNWNTAFTNTHTHSNKAILDATTASFTTALKTKLDGLNNYVLPTASATVLGGVKIGTNLSIDVDGVLSATDTTYTSGTISVLNTGTSTVLSVWSSKVLNDWLNAKNFVTASIIDGLASQTWVSNNFISNTHVVNGITETMISNWNTAFTNNHTHTNKTILDATTASFTTALKTKLDGLSNYVLPTASATVLGGIKVGTNLSIDANGVLSSTNTTYGVETLANLNTGTSTTGLLQSAKNLNDWLNGKGYLTASTVPASSLITSTSATGVTNVATTNTNTFLNIVYNGTSVGSSSQITGSGSVTVVSDANGKITITGTNTTYTAGTLAVLNAGTATTQSTWTSAILNDWLNGKNFVTASIIDGFASQTWVSDNFISNTHVANGITATNISNWNTAFTNNHTHTNKAILDATTASFTTALKTKLDGLSNYVLPTASATVLGGVKVGTNLSIDTNGVLSATNTTYGVETLANLNTGTNTTGLLQSAKNLNDWLNGKNFVTASIIDGLASQTWVSNNFISNTHAVNGITSAMISNWNTSFGWGNHSGKYISLNTSTNGSLAISTVDLNTPINGNYVSYQQSTSANKPLSSGGFLTNYYFYTSSTHYNNQSYDSVDSNRFFKRYRHTAEWVELYHTGNFSPSDYIQTTHVVNGITATNISNWNTAFTNNHTHSNKAILDATTASFTTALKTKLDGLSNYVLPTASATVLGGVKVGTNLSIDANGVLSATNTTYGVETLANLNTGTSTTGLLQSAKNLNDWLNGKNFVTASIIDGLATQTWVSDNFISNTHVVNGITATNISNWNTAFNNNIVSFTQSQTSNGTRLRITTNNNTYDTTISGIKVLDVRNNTFFGNADGGTGLPSSNLVPNNVVTPIFHYGWGGSGWGSSLIVKGWNSGYQSWMISGTANQSTSDDYDFYLRTSGADGAWNDAQKIWTSKSLKNVSQLTNDSNYLTASTVPASSLITSTSATGVTNVATTNTNTFLNIVYNGTSVGSSSQITGAGSVTVVSDANGKITITGTNTTYTAGTLAVLNAGTATTQSTWTSAILNDWLNGKNFVTASIIDGLASQTWVTSNFISNTHVVNAITSTNISNWNTAFTNNHTHSNKAILDATTASFTTALKTKLDGLSNYTLPIASASVLGGIKVGTNLSIDTNGVLSASFTENDPVYTASIPNQMMMKSTINENSDLDDYTVTGIYGQGTSSRVATFLNCPTTRAMTLEVIRLSSAMIFQRVTDHTTNKIYVRNYSTSWSSWKTMALTSDLSGYIPTSHVVNAITSTNISNWNTAYGWGDFRNFGLGIRLDHNSDANSSRLWDNGFYTLGTGSTNRPSYISSSYASGILTISETSARRIQIATGGDELRRLSFRSLTDTTSTEWLELYHTGNFNPSNYIPTTHVVNAITSTNISNWNTAFTNTHTHSNKAILDGTQESFTTALKTKLDGLSNYTLPIASASVLGGIKVGSNLSIDANGVLSSTNTTYSNMTIAELNTGTVTSARSISAKVLNDWLNGKNFVTASIIDGLASQTWVSDNFISNTHVVNAITSTMISNWNTAFTNNHTHTNKAILDATTASFTTALKTKLDGLSNYVLPTASATVLGGIKVGSNLSIDANGVLSATNTAYSVETLANLNTGTSTTGLLQSAKNLNDWLNGKGYLTASTVPASSLITSTSATGVTNVATTNTNTFLNIVYNGTSVGSSSQITGAGSVTVVSDANGKITITGTNTTYTAGTLAVLNAGTATTQSTWTSAILNDWLNGKNFVTASIIDGFASQTWVSDNFISNTHVANGITATNISNWNTAFTNNHTHTNKAILDATTASFTTALKTKLDGLSNYTLPIASASVLGGIKVGSNLTIDANGVLSATNTNTTYGVETLANLNTGTSTTGLLQSAKNLNDWANSKYFKTQVGTSTDMNLEYRNGTGQWTTTTTNTPIANDYGTWMNIVSIGGDHNNSSNWINQLMFPTTGTRIFFRKKINNGVWQPTVELWHTGNLSNPISSDNFVLPLKTITIDNLPDKENVQGKIWMGDVYALTPASTGLKNQYATLFTINGRLNHDKTQFAFNGGSGDIQYRKAWYNNGDWGAWRTVWDSNNLTNVSQLTNNVGYLTASTVPASSLITSTTATGVSNVATTNTNTFLNIVYNGTSVGSSSQITGAGSVTVVSDANGKITITGTNTTYTAGTLDVLNAGTATTQSTWTSAILNDWMKSNCLSKNNSYIALNINETQAVLGTKLYVGSSGHWVNKPTATGSSNATAMLNINTHSGEYGTQMFFDTGSKRTLIRHNNEGTVSNWGVIITSDNLGDGLSWNGTQLVSTASAVDTSWLTRTAIQNARNSMMSVDNRSVNGLVTTYYKSGLFAEFKQNTVIGLPSYGSYIYSSVLTFAPYADNTGNNGSAYQLAHSNGEFCFRSWNNSWGAWKTLATREWVLTNNSIFHITAQNGIATSNWNSYATGNNSFAIGKNTIASSKMSGAIGANVSTIGSYSIVVGSNSVNNGTLSTILGSYSNNSASKSGLLGLGLMNNQEGYFAVGRYNKLNQNYGMDVSREKQEVFAIGAGYDELSRQNIITAYQSLEVQFHGRAYYDSSKRQESWFNINNTLVDVRYMQQWVAQYVAQNGGGSGGSSTPNTDQYIDINESNIYDGYFNGVIEKSSYFEDGIYDELISRFVLYVKDIDSGYFKYPTWDDAYGCYSVAISGTDNYISHGKLVIEDNGGFSSRFYDARFLVYRIKNSGGSSLKFLSTDQINEIRKNYDGSVISVYIGAITLNSSRVTLNVNIQFL